MKASPEHWICYVMSVTGLLLIIISAIIKNDAARAVLVCGLLALTDAVMRPRPREPIGRD